MCIGVGDDSAHSRDCTASTSVNVLKYSGVDHGFAGATTFAVNALYITYRNTNTATNDIILPTELTTFHPVNASG